MSVSLPLSLLCVGGLLLGRLASAAPLAHVCVDENPWPPYTYWSGTGASREFDGYTVELATQIFRNLGLGYDITPLPWTEVHQRARSKDPNAGCDIVLDVSLTPERQAYLYFTTPLYQLHYALVYSSKRFPRGLSARTLADVNPYMVCGIEGYNYGTLASQLTIQRLPSIQQVLDRLESGQCEVFTVEASVLKYGQKMGLYKLPPLGCTQLEGISKSYRLGVAKRFPEAEKWAERIQRQLVTSRGRISELIRAHDIGPMECGQVLRLK